MIDVTLLLLFFFMLSGSLTKAEKLPQIQLPKAAFSQPQNPKAERDTVNIDASGQLFAGSVPVSKTQLAEHLKKRFQLAPPLQLAIRAEGSTPAKKIKEIMALAAEAGAIELVYSVRTP
jgi:biopolymer transport protein ExbD